jgi:hypothetical protein
MAVDRGLYFAYEVMPRMRGRKVGTAAAIRRKPAAPPMEYQPIPPAHDAGRDRRSKDVNDMAMARELKEVEHEIESGPLRKGSFRHSSEADRVALLVDALLHPDARLLATLEGVGDTYRGQSVMDFHKAVSVDGFGFVIDIACGDGRSLHVSARETDNAVLCAHFKNGRLEDASIEYRSMGDMQSMLINGGLASVLFVGERDSVDEFQVRVQSTNGLRFSLACCAERAPPIRGDWRWGHEEQTDGLFGLVNVRERLDLWRKAVAAQLWPGTTDPTNAVRQQRLRQIDEKWRKRWGVCDAMVSADEPRPLAEDGAMELHG